jgi:energy-converting hydrogenase Eha subunit H
MSLKFSSVYVATHGALSKKERQREKGREKGRNKQKEISLDETNIIKVTLTVTSSIHTGLYHTVSQNQNVSSQPYRSFLKHPLHSAL